MQVAYRLQHSLYIVYIYIYIDIPVRRGNCKVNPLFVCGMPLEITFVAQNSSLFVCSISWSMLSESITYGPLMCLFTLFLLAVVYGRIT